MFGWFRKKVSNAIVGLEEMTLDYINEIRSQGGMQPLAMMPAGVPGQIGMCVIANCFSDYEPGVWVTHENLVVLSKTDSSKMIFKHPDFVKDFIIGFDSGYSPHLNEKTNPERRKLVYMEDPVKYHVESLEKLTERLECLERSHEATARELRQKIRDLKAGREEMPMEYKELPV